MSEAVFFRLLNEESKGQSIASRIQHLAQAVSQSDEVILRDVDIFRSIPGAPFAYWTETRFYKLYSDLKALATDGRHVLVGASTKNDFRYLRLYWEIKPEHISLSREDTLQGRRWVILAKGGDFARYSFDCHLCIDWLADGAPLKADVSAYREAHGWGPHWTAELKGHSFYFLPGLTYPRRSQRGFSVRVLTKGCIFADKGPGILANDYGEALYLLGLLNSRGAQMLLSMQVAFGSYEVGAVQRIPYAAPSPRLMCAVGDLALTCHCLRRDDDRADETSHAYNAPTLLLGFVK